MTFNNNSLLIKFLHDKAVLPLTPTKIPQIVFYVLQYPGCGKNLME